MKGTERSTGCISSSGTAADPGGRTTKKAQARSDLRLRFALVRLFYAFCPVVNDLFSLGPVRSVERGMAHVDDVSGGDVGRQAFAAGILGI